MEGHQAESEEDKREPVLEHEAVHCAVHAAIGPAEREAGPKHRTERAVEHGDELEAHRHRRHAQIECLEQVVRLLGNIDLDDAVVGKAREQRGLRADGDAVLRVELQLLLANLEQGDLSTARLASD